MNNRDEFAPRVGEVALAQAEIDEWLVQVLIALLKPLPASRVELLVGGRSLSDKIELIKAITKDIGINLEQPLNNSLVPKELFTRIRRLDVDRNRAVHSYYEGRDRDIARQFRSRKGVTEPMRLIQKSHPQPKTPTPAPPQTPAHTTPTAA